MSYAFEITADDVASVLRRNSVRVANTQGLSFEAMGELLLEKLDTDAIEAAALDASTDLDEQTEGAFAEIERQLIENGTLKQPA